MTELEYKPSQGGSAMSPTTSSLLGVSIMAPDGTVLWVRWLRVDWVPIGQPWLPAIPPDGAGDSR